jgi:hypothetical protein
MSSGKTTTGRGARLRLALAAVIAAALCGPLSASAVEGPTGEGAAGGCALQCIEKALVTPTTSGASVEIVTSVRTRVVVTARALTNIGGLVAAQPDASFSTFLFRTERTVPLRGLEPATSYRITVSATDMSGRTNTRTGTFETRAVETAVDTPVGGFSAGLGCSAKCITKAVPVHVGPTAALFDVETNTPAKITMITSIGGSIASIATSPTLTTGYRHAASPLVPGTRYDLQVRATDADGRSEVHQFAFTTAPRKVAVTLWKVQLIDDGDKGKYDRGELKFDYWLGGKRLAWDKDWVKRNSGDVFPVRANGTSRQGLTATLLANGASPKLDIRVYAEECDGYINLDKCTEELYPEDGPTGGNDHTATAGGGFGLKALVSRGALPGNYGTLLPAGHDAYLVFETTKYGIKFRVFGFADISYG